MRPGRRRAQAQLERVGGVADRRLHAVKPRDGGAAGNRIAVALDGVQDLPATSETPLSHGGRIWFDQVMLRGLRRSLQ